MSYDCHLFVDSLLLTEPANIQCYRHAKPTRAMVAGVEADEPEMLGNLEQDPLSTQAAAVPFHL
jgi:hypothetical protein